MTKFMLTVFASVLVPAYAMASDLKIAVIDTAYVFANTSAATEAREELKGETEKAQAVIENMEKKLQKLDADLAQKKKTLSEEAFKKAEAEFREEYQEYRVKSQNLQGALTRQSMIKKKEIMDVIASVVEEVSIKRDLDVVLPRSAVMYASKTVDISEDVLSKVNKELKNKSKKGL